jgi:membrane-bound serine protease (ClpP class)
MVTISKEIWLIRDARTGELRYLDIEKHPGYRARAGAAPTDPKDRPILGDPWTYVRMIDPANKVLTMTAREARQLGFAGRSYDSLASLADAFGVEGEMAVLGDSTLEQVVAFLTSPAVSSILMFIGIMAIYAEINSPGIGIPAIIAILAFGILFGSRYLVGMAAYWEVILFVLGLALLALEIFVIPGFGIAGVSGMILIVVGLVAIFIANAPDELPWPETNLDWSIFTHGMAAMLAAFIASIFGAIALAKFLPKIPLANRLVLAPTKVLTDAGGTTTEDAPVRSIRPGDNGVTIGPLRPVGEVRIGDHIVDAVTEGDFLAPGTRVTVVLNEGYRLVVTPEESD